MLRIGVVGYGYWGPNLARNFSECPDTSVAAIADSRRERLDLAQRRHPSVSVTTDWESLLGDGRIDAIAIATPVSTHFEIAHAALARGKHVLVEKPMAASAGEALALVEDAERSRRVLMVDHTFVYTGAVRRIRDFIRDGAIGEVYYYDSTRINLGLFHQDVDVIWDLAVHDFSIMDYVLPQAPVEISATGVKHVEGATENIAYVTALYDGPLIAHVNVNWLSPVKVRRTLIGGSKQMIVYDDIEASEKVKVYDRGVVVKNGDESRYQLLVSYRSGDMHAPHIDLTESLLRVVQHFAECVQTGATPITDGLAGLRVVTALEAATHSMKKHGAAERLQTFGLVRAGVD